MTQDREAFIYVIQQGGPDGPVKIGQAKDPERRLKALLTGSPEDLALLGTSLAADAIAMERQIHAQFEHLKIRGEWFYWSEEIASFVRNMDTLPEPKHVKRAGTYPWWQHRDRARKRKMEALIRAGVSPEDAQYWKRRR